MGFGILFEEVTLVAEHAFELLASSVSPQMPLKVAFLRKSLPATLKLAAVWLFLGVNAQVLDKLLDVGHHNATGHSLSREALALKEL